MKKIVIYVRVSTNKQEVENQLIQLRKYCKKSNYEIYDEYIDIISGKETSRPAYDRMFKQSLKREVFNYAISRVFYRGFLYTPFIPLLPRIFLGLLSFFCLIYGYFIYYDFLDIFSFIILWTADFEIFLLLLLLSQ
ncbi:hypothetical protein ES703_96403 [subsurface metagenome]